MNASFVAAMETVLDFYAEPAQEGVVRLSFDEKPFQLLADKVNPITAKPSSVKKNDHEYARKGTGNLLLAYDLDQGLRHVETRVQRTKADFADFWNHLVSQRYPEARRIDVLLDNLNTHHYGSFYEHLPIERAELLRKKINFIYTPKHGSWLNVSEVEFSAFAKQCLAKRRISSIEQMDREVQHWVKARNHKAVKINWTFTTGQAREKFARQYSKIRAIPTLTSESDH